MLEICCYTVFPSKTAITCKALLHYIVLVWVGGWFTPDPTLPLVPAVCSLLLCSAKTKITVIAPYPGSWWPKPEIAVWESRCRSPSNLVWLGTRFVYFDDSRPRSVCLVLLLILYRNLHIYFRQGFSALIIHSMGREPSSVMTALTTPTHWPLAPSLHVVAISDSAAASLRKNYTFLAGKSECQGRNLCEGNYR